jgi:hypothetical protein
MQDVNEVISYHKDKYQRILEYTVMETNRILDSWVTNEKKRATFRDENSAFRSVLNSCFRHEYKEKRRETSIMKYQPHCKIANNMIKSISFASEGIGYYRYDNVIHGLITFSQAFDYDAVNEKFIAQQERLAKEKQNEVKSLVDISFDSITSIKF